jgi:integrase
MSQKGWVTRTPSGSFRAGYRAPDGTVKTKTFTRAGTAKSWLNDQIHARSTGEWVDPSKGRVKFVTRFEMYLESRDLRPSTRARYRIHGDRYILPWFARQRMNEITSDSIETWLADLRAREVGASTIDSSLRLLRSVLTHALRGASPATGVRGPKLSPAPARALELEEVAALTEAVPDRYRAMIEVLAFRGLRIGEVCGLRAEDLDLLRGRLSVNRTLSEISGRLVLGDPKTAAGRREMGLPAFLRDSLTEHLEAFSDPRDPEAYVFTAPGGGPVRPGNFRRRVFNPAAGAVGLTDVSPHNLRDTCASMLIAQGATVVEVARLLGHERPSITLDRYASWFARSAEEMDQRMDAAFRTASALPTGGVIPLSAGLGRTGTS